MVPKRKKKKSIKLIDDDRDDAEGHLRHTQPSRDRVRMLSCRDESLTCPSHIRSKELPAPGHGSRPTKAAGDKRKPKDQKTGQKSQKQLLRPTTEWAAKDDAVESPKRQSMGQGASRESIRGPRPSLVAPRRRAQDHPPPPPPLRPPTASSSWTSSGISVNKDGLPSFHCCSTDDIFFDTKNRYLGSKTLRPARQMLYPSCELRQRSEENLEAVTGPVEVESWLGAAGRLRDPEPQRDDNRESGCQLQEAIVGLKESCNGQYRLRRNRSEVSAPDSINKEAQRTDWPSYLVIGSNESESIPAVSKENRSFSISSQHADPSKIPASIRTQPFRPQEKSSCQNLELSLDNSAEISADTCQEHFRVMDRPASLEPPDVSQIPSTARSADESSPMATSNQGTITFLESQIEPNIPPLPLPTSQDLTPDISPSGSQEISRHSSGTENVSQCDYSDDTFESSSATTVATYESESELGSRVTSRDSSPASRPDSIRSQSDLFASRDRSFESRAASLTAYLEGSQAVCRFESQITSQDEPQTRVEMTRPASRLTTDSSEANSWPDETSSWTSENSRNRPSYCSCRTRKDVRVTVASARRSFSRPGGMEPRNSLGALIANLLVKYIGGFKGGTRDIRRRRSRREVSLVKSYISQLRAAALKSSEVARGGSGRPRREPRPRRSGRRPAVGSAKGVGRPSSQHHHPPRSPNKDCDVPPPAPPPELSGRQEGCVGEGRDRRSGCGDVGEGNASSDSPCRGIDLVTSEPHDPSLCDDEDGRREDEQAQGDDDNNESVANVNDTVCFNVSFHPKCQRLLMESCLSGNHDFPDLLGPPPNIRAFYEAVNRRSRAENGHQNVRELQRHPDNSSGARSRARTTPTHEEPRKPPTRKY